MAGSDDSREATFEETRSNLSEGLKACRAVLRNYRDLLTDESVIGNPHPPADNDDAD